MTVSKAILEFLKPGKPGKRDLPAGFLKKCEPRGR